MLQLSTTARALIEQLPSAVGASGAKAANPEAADASSSGARVLMAPDAARYMRPVSSTSPSEPVRPTEPCSDQLRLVASVVNEAQSNPSLAAVDAYGGTRVMHLGERIGGYQLVSLHTRKAYFARPDGALRATRELRRAQSGGRLVPCPGALVSESSAGQRGAGCWHPTDRDLSFRGLA
ncbi:MAG TPA: hypothetical protein VFX59_18510 [Polyangiales bacterium]|nr:hypothetical protein [Polyangiales bacterium]